MAEVNRLQAILDAGQIPDKQMDKENGRLHKTHDTISYQFCKYGFCCKTLTCSAGCNGIYHQSAQTMTVHVEAAFFLI